MEYTSDDSRQIFLENERKANLYVARCSRVMAMVAAVSWLLNLVGIFIIPPTVMNVGMPLCIIALMLPTALCAKLGADKLWMKHVVMISVMLGLSILTVAIPKHTILAWISPILLSCHYYSREMTVRTTWIAILCMAVSVVLALYLGEWDVNLMGVLQPEGARVVLPEYIRRTLLFFLLPRTLLLIGLSSIGISVLQHARDLLEKRAQDLAEQHRISSELNVAANIQSSMLPHEELSAEQDGVSVCAVMLAAQKVGGDFYDYYKTDANHLIVTVADVSGMGVGAALLMSRTMAILRAYAEAGLRPAEVLAAANNELCINNREKMSVSVWFSVLELSTGKLTYVNAGHEKPLLRTGGVYRLIETEQETALGIFAGKTYREYELTILPGDELLEYTGIADVANAKEEHFDEARMLEAANRHQALEPKEMLSALLDELKAFADGTTQSDDIAILALRR